MPGIYILHPICGAILQDRIAGDYWITGTWDDVDVVYVGF